MALSAFDDKSHKPRPAEVRKMLGKAAPLWDELVSRIGERFAPVTQLWAFSGANYGWSLRLRHKNRVILYMTPREGSFLAAIVLGDRALAAARQSRLPAAIVKMLESATRYAEGTGIRFPVSNRKTIEAVERLAECKMWR